MHKKGWTTQSIHPSSFENVLVSFVQTNLFVEDLRKNKAEMEEFVLESMNYLKNRYNASVEEISELRHVSDVNYTHARLPELCRRDLLFDEEHLYLICHELISSLPLNSRYRAEIVTLKTTILNLSLTFMHKLDETYAQLHGNEIGEGIQLQNVNDNDNESESLLIQIQNSYAALQKELQALAQRHEDLLPETVRDQLAELTRREDELISLFDKLRSQVRNLRHPDAFRFQIQQLHDFRFNFFTIRSPIVSSLIVRLPRMEYTGSSDPSEGISGNPTHMDVLEALPTFPIAEDHLSLQSACVICAEEFKLGEDAMELPCDKHHIFHSKCIRPWLDGHDTCPLCVFKLPASPLTLKSS
ncbi:hypothetical protein KI387_042053 [Taxus chinensis]|uniref:RING-type domain-containing protein n=1 Tax=Taxus chinensis TaxID=29808 RepID=A0AA38CAQ6_TAXCH|nr:hypothetical protein KI387_042053 [Taxus chinensis]